MRHTLQNIVVVSLGLILVGCQSGPRGPGAAEGQPGFFQPFYPNNYSNNQAGSMPLAQAVQGALLNSGDPALESVRVEAVQNTVRLTGYVKKIRQSDMAEQIARQVPGVQQVENRLIVRQ